MSILLVLFPLYVHFMRKKLCVQYKLHGEYTMQHLLNLRIGWVWSNGSNLRMSMIERIKFTDEYDQTDQIYGWVWSNESNLRMSMVERIESCEYEFPTHMNEFVRLYESTKCLSVISSLSMNRVCTTIKQTESYYLSYNFHTQ